MPSVPKYIPYRNKKILEAARGEACTNCEIQDGTVVFAHSNLQSDGKGVGKKADDCFGAFLCIYCHTIHHHSPGLGYFEFHEAMKRTWKRLLERGVLE